MLHQQLQHTHTHTQQEYRKRGADVAQRNLPLMYKHITTEVNIKQVDNVKIPNEFRRTCSIPHSQLALMMIMMRMVKMMRIACDKKLSYVAEHVLPLEWNADCLPFQ